MGTMYNGAQLAPFLHTGYLGKGVEENNGESQTQAEGFLGS